MMMKCFIRKHIVQSTWAKHMVLETCGMWLMNNDMSMLSQIEKNVGGNLFDLIPPQYMFQPCILNLSHFLFPKKNKKILYDFSIKHEMHHNLHHSVIFYHRHMILHIVIVYLLIDHTIDLLVTSDNRRHKLTQNTC